LGLKNEAIYFKIHLYLFLTRPKIAFILFENKKEAT